LSLQDALDIEGQEDHVNDEHESAGGTSDNYESSDGHSTVEGNIPGDDGEEGSEFSDGAGSDDGGYDGGAGGEDDNTDGEGDAERDESEEVPGREEVQGREAVEKVEEEEEQEEVEEIEEEEPASVSQAGRRELSQAAAAGSSTLPITSGQRFQPFTSIQP
jgi:hypothetical protein